MNPGGINKDMYLDNYEYDPIYLGPLDEDGYSLVSFRIIIFLIYNTL